MLVLGGVFVLVAAVFDAACAVAGAQLGRLLQARPRLWSAQRWVVGGSYVGLGGLAALTGHRPAAKVA